MPHAVVRNPATGNRRNSCLTRNAELLDMVLDPRFPLWTAPRDEGVTNLSGEKRRCCSVSINPWKQSNAAPAELPNWREREGAPWRRAAVKSRAAARKN